MEIQTAKRFYSQIEKNKTQSEKDWKIISDYIAPTMGEFKSTSNTEHETIDYHKLINSTALHALSILSSGMMSGLTSPSMPWFKFKAESNEDISGTEIEKWTDRLTEIVEDVLAKSDVYDVLPRFYQELAAFGSAAFFVEQDFKTIIKCTFLTINSYSVGINADGRINRFCRKFYKDTMSIVEEFGFENCPLAIQAEYTNKRYDCEHEVSHIIVPNVNYNPNKNNNREMRFTSVYFTDNTILRESGYRNFPVIFTRWQVKRKTDVFGYGIGHNVLGDVLTLQKMEQKKLIAVDKVIDPPLQINGQQNTPINTHPGGITSTNGLSIQPIYNVGLDFNALEQSKLAVERRVNEQFYVDVFQMIASRQDKSMTAYEVSALLGEKMMILGPIYHMIKTEGLDPLMTLVIEAGFDLNFFPPPPEDSNVKSMNIEYISTIAMAQKAEKIKILTQGLNWAGQVSKIGNIVAQAPVGDNVDLDGFMRDGLQMLGIPADTLTSIADRDKLRKQRAIQAQQQALQQQQERQLAEAKVLGGIKNSDGTNELEKVQQQGAGRYTL